MNNRLHRMWVNQPSELQPYHHLHGELVLYSKEDKVIYFLHGDIINQQIDPMALSTGWPEHLRNK